jgi:membrane fusion protein (multidrug efflux system)
MNRVVLIIIILSSLGFASCKTKQTPPTPPVPVNLFTVTGQHVLYYDRYPATTEALSQVDLHPEVQGYITGIYFKEGTHVKKGTKLYDIDKRLYEASYEQAVSNLKVDQGNVTQAQQDADRYEYLNKYNAIAKQLLDHQVIALQNSKNQVKAGEDAVKTAATNLTYSTIYAPFDGTIGFSQVKLGNLVTVGTTLLNTISTDDPMAVDFLINEAQLAHYQDLENPKQHSIDSLFTIILPNHMLYPYMGKISVIDRAVDPQTGTIRIRLVFPNPKYSLRAGMSCIVRVHNQDTTPQMLVPGKAVVEQMGEYFVFVAKDTVIERADSTNKKADTTAVETPKLRAMQRKVQLGQTIGANVIIQSGINLGDRIVIDGVQSLHDGSAISAGNKQIQGANKSDSNQNNQQGNGKKMDSSKNN